MHFSFPKLIHITGAYSLRTIVLLMILGNVAPLFAQNSPKKVFVLDIRREINPQSWRYVKLGLEQAEKSNADYVILDMNTYGGTLVEADSIRTRLIDFKKPVWVYINKNAASAGALIAISCDAIYMEEGSNIGAATVVNGEGVPAPDKYQAYMRSLMRSTAKANGRDTSIAEGMVGRPVGTDSITVGGVISFTTDEAILKKYCEGKVNSIEDILKLNNVGNYEIVRYELSSTDKVIDFFLNPILRSLLLLVIIGGIFMELKAPGTAFPIIASIVATLLYFIPSYLNGLAEYWEILIFLVGVGLLAVEIFVIPGFGVAGVAGIILMFSSLVLSVLNNDAFDFTFVQNSDLETALFLILLSILGTIILLIFGGKSLLNSKIFKKISLETTLDKQSGYVSASFSSDLIGKTGEAYTVLRPSGKVMIDGEIIDAYTRGEYIEKGEKIVIVEEGVGNVKVKRV